MVDLLALATAIAAQLPHWQDKGWAVVQDDKSQRNTQYIKHPDGPQLTLSLQFQGKQQHLKVYGSFATAPGTANSFQATYDLLNWEEKNGIKLSPNRHPADLARDIQRRLLQTYLPLYQQGLAATHSKQAELSECEQLLQHLAADLEARANKAKLTCIGFDLAPPNVWAEVKVNSPQRLTATLNDITPEQWARVLAVLKESTNTTEPPL